MTERELNIRSRILSFEKLNSHFKQLVRCSNGVSHVSHIPEYEEYSERVKKVAVLFIGKIFAKSAKLSGSVAQNLKCESSNSKGDADIMVLSDFPKIGPNNKDFTLVKGSETGFCKIKSNKPWGKYPCVKEDHEYYISASSLRQLDLVWWSKQLKPMILILDFLGRRTKVFNKFEQPENGAAINICWSSSYSTLGSFDSPGIRFYKAIISSYRKNIMPMLEDTLQAQIEEFFNAFTTFMRVAVHYIESDVYLLSDNQISDQDYEYGMVTFVMKFSSTTLQTNNVHLNDTQLDWLQEKCDGIMKYLDKGMQSLNIKEETRHKKTGSIDLIPGICCNGFPPEAKMWSARVVGKFWPNEQIVQDIIQAGFQLVPKASRSTTNPSIADTSFRYSFNDAENILCLSLTEMQREVFRILKMFFYEKLQTDPKVLETYHLKTLLFWFIEESKEEVWVEDNLAFCCLALMERLMMAMKQKYLAHYFIPEINLFQYLDKDALNDLALIAEDIIIDPVSNTGNIMMSIRDFYNKKIERKCIKYDEFKTDEFFIEADKFYNHVTRGLCKEDRDIRSSNGMLESERGTWIQGFGEGTEQVESRKDAGVQISIEDKGMVKYGEDTGKQASEEDKEMFKYGEATGKQASKENKEMLKYGGDTGVQVLGEDKEKVKYGEHMGVQIAREFAGLETSEEDTGVQKSEEIEIPEHRQKTKILESRINVEIVETKEDTGRPVINGKNEDIPNSYELHCVLRFLSDLMFARKMEDKQRARNLADASRKNLRISPLLPFFLIFLPVISKPIKRSSETVLGRSQTKVFKKIAFFRRIFSIVDILFRTNCIGILVYLITLTSRLLKSMPIHRLGRKLFTVSRHRDITHGPSSQFLSFVFICISAILILAFAFLCIIFGKLASA